MVLNFAQAKRNEKFTVIGAGSLFAQPRPPRPTLSRLRRSSRGFATRVSHLAHKTQTRAWGVAHRVAHRVAHKVAHRVAHGLARGPRPRFCPHPSSAGSSRKLQLNSPWRPRKPQPNATTGDTTV